MLFGDGPSACPFVAFESDRDSRADEPDHRHRCYAEPEPAPRALAHQRAFCLSPSFPGCPIFQDWAVRAAARPVAVLPDTPEEPPPETPRRSSDWASPPPWAAAPSESGDEPEQLSAFDQAEDSETPADEHQASVGSPPPEPGAAPIAGDTDSIERVPSLPVDRTGDAARDAELEEQRRQRILADRERRAEDDRRRRLEEERRDRERRAAAAAAVPPFLAGRGGTQDHGATQSGAALGPHAPQAPQAPPPRDHARRSAREEAGARRADLVPVWEREPIRAYPTMRRMGMGGSGDALSRLTTILAVLAVIALVVFVIILLPSLMGDGGGAGPTAPVAGASPTAPTATATPSPVPTETPQSTPRTYTVRAGDTLFGIAQQFGLTVDQLLAANPQITDANLVTIGQVLTIPEEEVAPPRSPRATP
jgi:LysM repeat protein